MIDIENEPVRWNAGDPNVSFPWGLPAQARWFEQATPFEGVTIEEPADKPAPLTLEQYLAERG